MTKEIPKERGIDHTFSLLTEGYNYVGKRMSGMDTDIFETRLLGKKMIIMTGRDAAELFYDETKFKREGALPLRVQKTLFGVGGIQTMDGQKHKIRKAMFMSLMSDERLGLFRTIVKEEWDRKGHEMERKGEAVLFDESEELILRAICRWTGVPLTDVESWNRAYDIGSLIDAAGGVGKRFRVGEDARPRTEAWLEEVILAVREGRLETDPESAAHVVAFHQESGEYLDAHMAALELLNVIRPAVAVARFVVFAALALHDFPEWKEKLNTQKDLNNFANEVRRFYPFTPFLGAIAKKDFEWHGYEFNEGETVLMDFHGVNRDPRLWEEPEQFNPDRFNDFTDDRFTFIPQGGGDPNHGHRCPGEPVTVIIIEESIRFLVNGLEYNVPQQDLMINMVRMPTLPASRFVMDRIKVKED
ncbi:cytochrome P450 [Bhargavaea cecembensis]|uniref:cytochrome P450 n=1 Tax=Bhargavaea cecembensis TaxID=394098 RepID=UPI00058F76D9|nr:cytochrome P450 [Bhargavaea cecembensis]